ncbi:Hypothetical predicted protein [Podarcis lilfordi]|uniref:Uncharacterized protein n=1 Tax=Podarcis lilfordi TaxID=74358 RepID=A0AA35PI93_9SAUR|nr:Hypothetical predicted protein [Podarcis lilfordi]
MTITSQLLCNPLRLPYGPPAGIRNSRTATSSLRKKSYSIEQRLEAQDTFFDHCRLLEKPALSQASPSVSARTFDLVEDFHRAAGYQRHHFDPPSPGWPHEEVSWRCSQPSPGIYE